VVKRYPDYGIVNLDKLTYAGNLENLKEVEALPNYTFIKGDIGDAGLLKDVFKEHRIDSVVHLAAESHVDRSILGPEEFLGTNVMGTFTLLETARSFWKDPDRGPFINVSTDEVYGSLPDTGRFTELSPYAPNSPYAASKAASDHQGLSPYLRASRYYDQLVQQLRPLPVPGKTHPPYDTQRRGGEKFTRVRRRAERKGLALRF
jgi:dTDP-glucose 4,6-dehydratase